VAPKQPYGYIDTSGLFVVPPQFAVANDFSEGLAAVKLDSFDMRWCYIDRTGRIVVKPLGEGRADKFTGGLTAVDLKCPKGYLAKGAIWGYIDATGKVICKFTRASSQ